MAAIDGGRNLGWRRVLVLLYSTAFCGTAAAADKPHLTWIASASPPTHIDDKRAGPGIADETLDWFIARLPEFDHEVIVADSLRLENMLATSDGICAAALVRSPERLAFTVFSKPVYWSEPPRLVANAAKAAEIDSHADVRGAIDLPALIDDPRLSGGRLLGRSYSLGADRALNAAKPTARLLLLTHARELDMLANSRFDWTISLPIHIAWWAQGFDSPSDRAGDEDTPARTTDAAIRFKFITRQIAGEPEELIGYMGCSNREIGRRAIAAVDRIIDDSGPNPPWTAFYLKWLDTDSKADWLRRHGPGATAPPTTSPARPG
jgi:polar amino acid transport system substrate-binding protein